MTLFAGHGRITDAPPLRARVNGLIIASLILLLSGARDGLAAEWLYAVRPGDNLWNISRDYLIDMRHWQRLQALNKVKNPHRLPPGMLLRIPVAWLKVQPASVRVLYVGGAASVLHATGQADALTPGMQLVMGDAVRTHAGASVTMEFADGSRLWVQENSQLVFDMLSVYGKTGMVDTRLRLLDGRLESDVKPVREPAGRFEIWTPAATSAVRGTRFRAALGGIDDKARTEVTAGNVAVSGTGKSVPVTTGFGTVVAPGQPPPPPRPLLPAPDLSGLPAVSPTAAPRFTLTRLAQAVSYRVQLVRARQPDALLLDQLFPDVEIQGPVLAEDHYLLKVRGVDEVGLEGMDAIHAFVIDILPLAPGALLPAADAQISNGQVQFQWQGPATAASYVFELAPSEDFAQPLFVIEDVTSNSWQPDQPLPPGVYFWRIATVDQKGKRGLYSAAQRLVIQEPPLLAPSIVAVTAEGNAVQIRWEAVGEVAGYEVQLAYDEDFGDIYVTQRESSFQTRLSHPGVESYYLRVRYVDADGQPSAYGPVYHVPVRPRVLGYWGVLAVFFGVMGL